MLILDKEGLKSEKEALRGFAYVAVSLLAKRGIYNFAHGHVFSILLTRIYKNSSRDLP
jgi:hypothetical protein